VRIFLAGATGVIGRPLVPALLGAGHEVTALARTPEKAKALEAQGAEPALTDAFDDEAVREAVVSARPEVVIHQLTALPRELNMRKYFEQLEPTNRLRAQTTPYFLAAAREAGARRVIFQSVSFITAPEGPPVVDESAPLIDGPPAEGVRTMERLVLGAEALEGIVLRYGFFYGPGTHYAPDGHMVGLARKRQLPIVGSGEGRSSFVALDDAVAATVLALDHGAPGVYNVTDDEPAPASEWIPELARLVRAKPPRRLPAWLVRLLAGEATVLLATQLRGNSNAKAKAQLGFAPRWPRWREGFAAVLAGKPERARLAA
jgi:nucleoside-diphosphate-sugar epimerase